MTYEEKLKELVDKDDRIIVMTAENRAAIRNLPHQIGDKFIDTGITEMTLVGAAAGLALRGRIPITHALATFLTMRAFEFIRTDVGISGLPVKMVGGFSGFLSEANGPTHQAVEDISIMRGIPNVNVWCPADEDDMLIGMESIIMNESPFYIRYTNQTPVIKHDKNFEIGKAEVISEGDDVTFLVYGILFNETYKAKNILEKNGYSAGLINLRTVKPIDEEAVLKAVKKSKLIVTVEDHFLTGGLFSILAEILLKKNLTADVLPIALKDKWFKPVLFNDVLEYEGFTAEQIAEKVKERI
jgi:transketolase